MDRKGEFVFTSLDIESFPSNPWGRADWGILFYGQRVPTLQRAFRSLSQKLVSSEIDSEDRQCMGVLFNTWGKPIDDQNIVEHVRLLQASQRSFLQKILLDRYFLELEQ